MLEFLSRQVQNDGAPDTVTSWALFHPRLLENPTCHPGNREIKLPGENGGDVAVCLSGEGGVGREGRKRRKER